MLLGKPMAPSTVSGWRFVESDLHDIASRVTEYDQDARLVREDETGQLGLARWQHSNLLCAGGYWALARAIHDLDTDLPMMGEPDARVIRFQRATDSYGRNLRKWYEKSQDAEWRREKRWEDDVYDSNGDHAERFVSALAKDVSAKPRTYVPEAIPQAS